MLRMSAGKACSFSFQELCGRPVAAADYIGLSEVYHTVALRGVPVFSGATRTEAYRFVTLVDVLYEHRCGNGRAFMGQQTAAVSAR